MSERILSERLKQSLNERLQKPTNEPKAANDAATDLGFMRIEKRVLRTSSQTLALRNVCVLSTFTTYHRESIRSKGAVKVGKTLVLIGSFIFFLVWSLSGFFGLYLGYGTVQNASAVALGLLAIGLLSLIFGRETKLRREHHLSITSNDGSKLYFVAKEERILEQVRDLLTEKINADDETATFNINFANGDIQVLNAGSINTDAIIQGRGNTTDIDKNVATGDGARAGTADTTTNTTTTYTATNSPGAQLGTGNTAFGNENTFVQRIDYAQHPDTLAKWRAFLEQQDQAGTAALRQRIESLEYLLRDGTPGQTERKSVLAMAADLSQIMQGYPNFIQLMQAIARLAAG